MPGEVKLEKQPLVSVIMNCYNGEKFLKEAIDSVYAQTYSNWEIIFWDNASTDGSATIANSYDDRVKYYRAKQTAPLYSSRNLALDKCQGEYIAFLDCDDVWVPKKLTIQLELLIKSKLNMVYSSHDVIDQFGNITKLKKKKEKVDFIFTNLMKRYDIGILTVMIKRQFLIDNALRFHENLYFSGDFGLFCHIAYLTSIGVSNQSLAYYRVHDASITSNFCMQEKMNEYESLRIYFQSFLDSEKMTLMSSYLDFITNITMVKNYVRKDEFGRSRRYIRKCIKSRYKLLACYLLMLTPKRFCRYFLRRFFFVEFYS